MKFLGVTILQGVEFPTFLLIFEWALQQCSATALPVVMFMKSIFTSATLSSAGIIAVVVYLSVRLSQVGVLLKRLKVGSRKQRRTIAHESSFLTPKIVAKLKRGHTNGGVKCRWGVLNVSAAAEN